MYRMGRYELMQYEKAEQRLQKLKIQHAAELQHAYDDINPTLTCFDYGIGTLYSSSVDPADYAIYLVEMQEEHKRKEQYWAMRVEAYKQAINNSEKNKTSLQEALSEIVSKRPQLQRAKSETLGDLEEYDKEIDNMNDEELFKDYWNLDDHLEQNEKITDRCLWLRNVQDMTYKRIGETIGITSSRAKEIIKEAN